MYVCVFYTYIIGVMKIGNIAPRAGLEPTFTLLTVYMLPCLRGKFRLQRSFPWIEIGILLMVTIRYIQAKHLHRSRCTYSLSTIYYSAHIVLVYDSYPHLWQL